MGEHLKNTVEKLEQEGKTKLKEVGLALDSQHLDRATKDIASDSYGAVKVRHGVTSI